MLRDLLAGNEPDEQPSLVDQAMTFSYDAGTSYLMGLLARTGRFAALDQALADPPLSTERVLHPDSDRPIMLSFDVALPGWDEAPVTVVGERWYRVVLADDEAAAGWGGDLVRHFREPGSGRSVTVAASTWDSPADADAAEAA